MKQLRRISPLLAVVLALVIGGAWTDAWPCADADCGVWTVLLHPGAPSPDGGEEGPSSACLCQVAFVPTAVLPVAPVPEPEAGALGNMDRTRRPSPVGRVPYPPPRG